MHNLFNNHHVRQALGFLLGMLVLPLASVTSAGAPNFQAIGEIGTLLAVCTGVAVYFLQRRGERRMEVSAMVATQEGIANSATAFSALMQDQVKALTRQMEELRSDFTEAQGQIKTLQSDLVLRTSRIEELERQLKTKTDELQTMREQYGLLEQRFNGLSRENVDLRAEIHRLQSNLHESAPGTTTTTTTTSVAATTATEAAASVTIKTPAATEPVPTVKPVVVTPPAKAPPPTVQRKRRRRR